MDELETNRIKLQKRINKILSDPIWPPNLKTGLTYSTTHDDNEGDSLSGFLSVWFTCDGDAWIKTESKNRSSLRFRMPLCGGGHYPKIRNALLLLAEAIRQEGLEP